MRSLKILILNFVSILALTLTYNSFAQTGEDESAQAPVGATTTSTELVPVVLPDGVPGESGMANVSASFRNARGGKVNLAFNLRTQNELREFLPELGRLAPGRKIKLVWVSPGEVPADVENDLKTFAPANTESISFINIATLNTKEFPLQVARAIEDALPPTNDADAEEVTRVLNMGAEQFSAGFAAWEQEASTAGRLVKWGEARDLSKSALDRMSGIVGYLKSGGSITVWLSKAMAAHSAATASAVTLSLAATLSPYIAAASGVGLDYWFAKNAEWYVDAKRKAKFPVFHIEHKPLYFSPIQWGKTALRYLARKWNSSSAFVKATVIDNTVGLVVNAYFRELASLVDPETSNPIENTDFIQGYVATNLGPALIGSAGDVSVSSLMEKKVFPRVLRWAFLQSWAASFWARNTINSAGLGKFEFFQILQQIIVWGEIGTKIGVVGLDYLLPPLTKEAKIQSTLLPAPEKEEFVIRIFAPGVTDDETTTLKVLNRISNEIDIGTRNPHAERGQPRRLILTRSDLEEAVTAYARPIDVATKSPCEAEMQ